MLIIKDIDAGNMELDTPAAKAEGAMSKLNIEAIIKGIASGQYPQKAGSQFGSTWRSDGLLETEASPKELSDFGAAANTRLCHSKDITWLDREWSVILSYFGDKLAQISIYTTNDEQFAGTVVIWLSAVLGTPKESPAEYSWLGSDGLVALSKTPQSLQLDARRFKPLELPLFKLKSLFKWATD
jgi:hypothetical protein